MKPTNEITCDCPVRIGRKELVAYSVNNPGTKAPKRVLSRISGSIKNDVKVLTDDSAKGLIEKNFDSILSSRTASFSGEGMIGSRSIGDVLYAVMGKYTQGIFGHITSVTGVFIEGEYATIGGHNYRIREFDNVNNLLAIDNLDDTGLHPLSSGSSISLSITGATSGATATFNTQGAISGVNQYAHIFDVAQNNCHPKLAFYRFGCVEDGALSTNKNTSYITEGQMVDKFEIDFESEKRLNFKLDTKGTELKNLDPDVLTDLFTTQYATDLENFAKSSKTSTNAHRKDDEINFVSCNASIYIEPIDSGSTIYEAVSFPVKSLKLMINKNLSDEQTIGTGGCGERFIFNKQFEADGELETFKSNIPLADIGKVDYRARIVIKPSGDISNYPLGQTGNVLPQIEIDIPKVSFSARSENDNLDDIITQNIKFVCSYQSDSTANSNMPRSIRFIVKNDVASYPV